MAKYFYGGTSVEVQCARQMRAEVKRFEDEAKRYHEKLLKAEEEFEKYDAWLSKKLYESIGYDPITGTDIIQSSPLVSFV